MKPLHIKFNEQGIVSMFSEKERPSHICTNDYPTDFKQNPTYYQLKIDNQDLVGLELRDDLEAHIAELEKQRQEEINQFT